ncbi:hypothetical protein LR48_Vigan11g120800 [Vigna angularis]|uniref:Uncharacterized protein n=1 Tax=Phaseolus angularis TaxID=3914 RepID=A0A0L9VTS6_PHAAN|nr:hypothetical protein LR48_Vigan11g120800 [Vigna angularis]
MAESSKRQRVRESSSTGGGRRCHQPSPPQNSPPPSPPPSPTAEHHNVQFSTPSQAQRNSPPPPQRQRDPPPELQLPPVRPTSRFDDVMTGINCKILENIWYYINDLRTFVGDNFNTLNETMNARFEQLELNMGDRFDTIDARVENVEHDIQYLRRHFGPHGGSSS